MNAAHLHLILNHIPLLTLPTGLIFFLHACRFGNPQSKKFALSFLIFSALTSIAVFLTGEPAEEVVEHLPGVTDSLIHSHEEAGELALIGSLVCGFFAGVQLFVERVEAKGESHAQNRLIRVLVILSALGATTLLAYSANLGGRIRHTEIRDGAAQSAENNHDD